MTTMYADQYECRAVVADVGVDNVDDVIARCSEIGAIYDDGESDCLVVVLRREVGPELWSEDALRRSFPGEA